MGPTLYIKGIVAAGTWGEAMEVAESEWEPFTGRSDVAALPRDRFGLRVEGDSMNQLYPPGTILECVSVFGHIEIEPGKRVIVLRERTDGKVEATVKELVEDNDELWLVPRSTNPAHQAFKLDDSGDPEIVETRITAIVVASIRQE